MTGQRVGAILGSDSSTKTLTLLGYGVYEGDHPMTGAVGAVSEMIAFGNLNPRIRLDSGQTVWGCECWWGDEAKILQTVEAYLDKGWTIETADIDEVRAEYRRRHG